MRLNVRQLFVIVLFLALFSMALRPIADADFWWHLRTGQWMVETRAVPHADPFSFTNQVTTNGDNSKTWIAHEWLSELFIYVIYRIGGFGLLILAFAAIITATFFLVYLRSTEHPYVAGFALLLGALAAAPTWGVRPQMISYLLSALFLFLLDRYAGSRKTKYLIPLPLLMLLWVNLHAAYALGFAIIGIYIVGDIFELIKAKVTKTGPANLPTPKNGSFQQLETAPTGTPSRPSATENSLRRQASRPCRCDFNRRRISQPFNSDESQNNILILCGILLLCVLAALANPNGIRLLAYPFETLSSQAMQQNIQEWFSPDFHQIEWQPLAWLILALIGAGLLGRKSLSPTRVLLTLVFGYMALRSMRHAPLFAIAALPVLAEEIGSLVRTRSEVRPARGALKWVNFLLVACVVLVAGLRFVSVVQEQSATEKEKFPAAAVDWIIQNHPAGNIFNTYGWGGYLIWRLYPEYQVYIDGRADVYGGAFIADYLRIESGEAGWQASLARNDVRIALLEPGSLLARDLRQSPDWEIAFSDEQSVLFIHK